MFRRFGVVLGVLSLVFSVAGVASAQYYVTDLGVLPGGTASYAMAVNDSGVVAGSSRTGTNAVSCRATIYTGGAWVNIGSAVSNTSGTFATGINNNGQVTGWLRSTAEDTFIYQNGTYTHIGARRGSAMGWRIAPVLTPTRLETTTVPAPLTTAGKPPECTCARTANRAASSGMAVRQPR